MPVGELVKGKELLLASSDIVIWPQVERQRFVLSNVFARTHVDTNGAGLRFIDFCLAPRSAQEIRGFVEFQGQGMEFTDRTCFSNLQGLLADPSNLVREPQEDDAVLPCRKAEEILALLEKRHILTADREGYLELFQKKGNPLDDKHLGNFHQQLGHELRGKSREDPHRWWLNQKFTEDGDSLRENGYRFIQLHFWESFFSEALLKGKKVLDVGCGPGFYSRFLARRGAQVLGIDPNPDFIEKAVQHVTGEGLQVEYRRAEIGTGKAFESISSGFFDLIVFQDAFLFYFVPYQEGISNDRAKVLGEIKRVLKPEGTLFVIEPHGVFWLSPWMGEASRPFTILTEYAKKQFGVTPSLSELSNAFYESGFLIRRVMELFPSEEASPIDPRGFGFSKQFPLWWCFELVKAHGENP